jgi:hypothetical protein
LRSPARETIRGVLVYTAAAVFAGAVLVHVRWLGGPYLEIFPDTIQDHVYPVRFLSRDAIVLSRRAEPLLPRGATVTILAPSEAPNYDQTHWLTAIGTLPRNHPVPPRVDGPPETLPQFVIAIADPFPNAHYHQVAQFPEGFLYERNR